MLTASLGFSIANVRSFNFRPALLCGEVMRSRALKNLFVMSLETRSRVLDMVDVSWCGIWI